MDMLDTISGSLFSVGHNISNLWDARNIDERFVVKKAVGLVKILKHCIKRDEILGCPRKLVNG